MSHFNIRLDLLKIKGACIRMIQGKQSNVKCLIIPIENNEGLYHGEKGLYLNLSALEMQEARYEDTHLIKINLSKEQRGALTEEQRKATPILGGMKPVKQRQGGAGSKFGKFGNAVPLPATPTAEGFGDDDDDLPF